MLMHHNTPPALAMAGVDMAVAAEVRAEAQLLFIKAITLNNEHAGMKPYLPGA